MIVTAKFDTVKKTLEVDKDGEAVADVAYVEMFRGYSDEKKFGCSLATHTNDEANGCTHMTRLSATERGLEPQPDGKEIQAAIAAYLSRE